MSDNEVLVGPGNPPIKHRWKKGDPSPNPRGRPPKKKLEAMIAPLDKYAEMIDRLGSTIVRGANGDYELRESYMRGLVEIGLDKNVSAKDRTVALKAWSDIDREALRVLNDQAEKQFNIALDYKERWTSVFHAAEARGARVPPFLPHPDDIVLEGSRVAIVGPKTQQEQVMLEKSLQIRAALMMLFEEGVEYPQSEQGNKNLKEILRHLRTINKVVPPRLVVPLPVLPKVPPISD